MLEILCYFVMLRNRLLGHHEPLNEEALASMEDGLNTLINVIGSIFRPYHGLQLALVSETDTGQEKHLGIHCHWRGSHFSCVTNSTRRAHMQRIWSGQPVGGTHLLPAPLPPRPEWRWNWSLLLFDPLSPYERYVYLMPLGSRYEHQEASQGKEVLPGLVDSVRWQRQRVTCLIQRNYRGKLPLATADKAWQESLNNQEAARTPDTLEFIQRLVKALCERYGFKLPGARQRPTEMQPIFDLGHGSEALRLAKASVPRSAEVQRILRRLFESPDRRLLLEGPSGSGKTVLLAQIYAAMPGQAVYFSLNHHVAPVVEIDGADDKSRVPTLAVPVRMHYLTVLSSLAGTQPPTLLLSAGESQEKLRNLMLELAQRSNQPVLLLADGLHQASDPGGMTSVFPDPLPSNCFVLASTQPRERVRVAVTRHGRQPWAIESIDVLTYQEAEAVIQHHWRDNERPELPTELVRAMSKQSRPTDFPDGLGHSFAQAVA
ncbi:MAG: hypothetical protein R3F37_03515 [Candidatus Competibacteraceae bacterium]